MIVMLTLPGFTVLNLFTQGLLSQQTSTLPSTNCGYFVPDYALLFSNAESKDKYEQIKQITQVESKYTDWATTYISECYGSDPESSTCGLLSNKRLKFTTEYSTSCPFHGLCIGIHNTAFTMTTHNATPPDFGVNSDSKLTWSQQSICAPVATEPFRADSSSPDTVTGHAKYFGKNITQITRDDNVNA
jgi:hypothetical protein